MIRRTFIFVTLAATILSTFVSLLPRSRLSAFSPSARSRSHPRSSGGFATGLLASSPSHLTSRSPTSLSNWQINPMPT